jgi:hypothetical protein
MWHSSIKCIDAVDSKGTLASMRTLAVVLLQEAVPSVVEKKKIEEKLREKNIEIFNKWVLCTNNERVQTVQTEEDRI